MKSVTAYIRSYETAAGWIVTWAFLHRDNLIRETRWLRKWGFKKFGPITVIKVPVGSAR